MGLDFRKSTAVMSSTTNVSLGNKDEMAVVEQDNLPFFLRIAYQNPNRMSTPAKPLGTKKPPLTRGQNL